MGSTVFFHNGFGDYVIHRGALSLLASRLDKPTRLIYGEGTHDFLVKDLPFDVFLPTRIAPPNRGNGRYFDVSAVMDASSPTDTLVNLASWEGPSIERLRAQLQPARYVWNSDWMTWDERGPNVTEIAYHAVKTAVPDAVIADLRLPPAFRPELEHAVDKLLRQLRDQGYARYVCVHLDSSESKPWPAPAVADAVCAVLARHADVCVLVIGREDKLPRCPCHGGRVVFLENLSLEASMCIVSRCSAIVGVDSCMMKVADQFGLPGAALFATARDAVRWGSYWTPFEHIVLTQQDTDVAGRIFRALLEGLEA